MQILKAQTRKIKLSEGFDYAKVIEKVPINFTGADFYGLTSRAIMKASDRAIKKYEESGICEEIIPNEEDFIEIAQTITPSVSEK